jgi:hypothetical protein
MLREILGKKLPNSLLIALEKIFLLFDEINKILDFLIAKKENITFLYVICSQILWKCQFMNCVNVESIVSYVNFRNYILFIR